MKNLREARIRVGLSQGELAEKLGVAQPTISNWERGKGEPSEEPKKILRIVLDFGEGKNGVADASPFAA
jgi:DNA-binding transcriptional regulator YiaG